MGKRRFAVDEVQVRRILKGTITIDDIRKKFNIPKDAEVTFTVPGGGDWSGADVDVTQLNVRWEEIKTDGTT